jgi:hypothetical protein
LRVLDVRRTNISLEGLLSCLSVCGGLRQLWLPNVDSERFLERADLSSLRVLGFQEALTDRGPALLAQCQKLVSLVAPSCRFDSAVQLAPLQNLKDLKYLSLRGLTLQQGRGFPVLSLDALAVSGLHVREGFAACLEGICANTGLQELDISDASGAYTDPDPGPDWRCFTRLQRLESLNLRGIHFMGGEPQFLRGLPALRRLFLQRSCSVSLDLERRGVRIIIIRGVE